MRRDSKELDDIDRKLLGLLTENAELSYAILGEKVGLSPPAVHERVKRYKSTGRIQSVVASLNPEMTGKPFLAFIHINTTGWGKSDALMRFGNWPEVETLESRGKTAGESGSEGGWCRARWRTVQPPPEGVAAV